MVMIIKHIVTNDGWHAYDVIGVYNIFHGAGRISYFAEPPILWLAGTVMGEVGPGTGGMPPWSRDQDHWSENEYCTD